MNLSCTNQYDSWVLLMQKIPMNHSLLERALNTFTKEAALLERSSRHHLEWSQILLSTERVMFSRKIRPHEHPLWCHCCSFVLCDCASFARDLLAPLWDWGAPCFLCPTTSDNQSAKTNFHLFSKVVKKQLFFPLISLSNELPRGTKSIRFPGINIASHLTDLYL